MTPAERIFAERFPELYASGKVRFPGDSAAEAPRGKLASVPHAVRASLRRTTTLSVSECRFQGLCIVCGTRAKLIITHARPQGKRSNYCCEHADVQAAYQREYKAINPPPSRAKTIP